MGYGIPKTIISDRDPLFISTFWQELHQSLDISLLMSTARHQQTNGGTEHLVKMIKNCLIAISCTDSTDWPTKLTGVQLALNTSVSTTTGFTPAYLAFGLNPRSSINNTHATLDHKELYQDLAQAQLNIARQQDKMETMANDKRQLGKQIKIGDYVLLNKDGINWPAHQLEDSKLLPKRLGPFKVLQIDSRLQNYKLDLPWKLKIHKYFHRSVIVYYETPSKHFPQRLSNPVIESSYPDVDYDVEKIISHRIHRKAKQYLIKWMGYGFESNSWEPEANLDAPELIFQYWQSRGGVVDFSKSPKITRNLQVNRLALPST